MKRNLLFLIVISLLLTLSACSKESVTLPDISDYNSEAFIPATSDSTADSSDIDPSDGFSVKDRKYTYENTGVVLLNVKNNTKKNYTVTIHGTYLDENGDVIGRKRKPMRALPPVGKTTSCFGRSLCLISSPIKWNFRNIPANVLRQRWIFNGFRER